MATVEIEIKVKIFDHPHLCTDGEKYCGELYRMEWIYFCHIFKKHGADRDFIKQDEDIFNYPIKCPECKEAHKKAKS